jgi:glycosyltransferase involved in cell wall biosynthesis
MTETIRVMWVAAPYKIHLYSSIARFFPRNIELKVVSAAMAYNGTIPFLGRFKRIWPLPRKDLLRQFIEFHPDVVFTDYPAYPSWYARLYSHLSEQKVPLVTWLLGDFWTEYYALLRSQRLRDRPFVRVYLFTWATGLGLSNRVLTVCEWLKKRAEQRLPRKRISVQYQGVDPEPWLVKDGTSYDFKKPAVGILQDNNIRPKVEGLLRFVEVLKKMPKVNFYIAGGGPYTPLVEGAFSGLPNAHLVGKVPYPDGVRKFYKSCNLYVLPSGLDCCPTTLLEASLNSLPVVASRVGGIPELVREGETGWTVPNGSTDDWIVKIRTLLENGKLASRMGGQAKKHVLANFTWEKQAQLLSKVFQEELGR